MSAAIGVHLVTTPHILPAMTLTQTETTLAATEPQPTTAKRGGYVARACWDCQRRKVKCSGEQPCRHCRVAGVNCAYSSGRFRRSRARGRQRQNSSDSGLSELQNEGDVSANGRHQLNPVQSSRGAGHNVITQERAAWKSNVLTRIASLERQLQFAQSQQVQVAEQSSSDPASSLALTSPRALEDNGLFATDDGDHDVDDSRLSFQTGTDLITPISMLERQVRGSFGDGSTFADPATHLLKTPAPSSQCNRLTSSPRFSGCCARALRLWNETTRDEDIEKLRTYINTYFTCMNRHHLGIDEGELLAQFQRILAQDYTGRTTMDVMQTVALVYLMLAVVKILDNYCVDSKKVPGWEEFTRATHLLGHTTWMGRGDFRTIQCLHLKTVYCLFIERPKAAADSISTAVRLCYQLGLHDQNSWQPDDTLYPPALRQRLFWGLYCLDRQVALACGIPYLIRSSDFRVDVHSPNVDNKDGSVFMGSEPTPSSSQHQTVIPYLQATIKWATLCSEIWDALFGMNASKARDQDFIVAMNARILLLIQTLPDELKWNKGVIERSETEALPLYAYRQSIIINLRANHLRLLLRRPEMVELTYDENTAQACVEIATESINAIYTFHTSTLSQRTDRYSAVTFLAGAVLPLICIIVRERNKDKIGASVVASFDKALVLLQDISGGLSFARRTLQRLNRLVEAANGIIMDKSRTEVVPPPEDEQWLADTFASLDKDWFLLTDEHQALLDSDDCTSQSFVHNSFMDEIARGDQAPMVEGDDKMTMFDLMY